MPHIDAGITDEKLTYKQIKKPFETQSDELHNAIRDKMMKKQLRKRRKEAAIAEFERREREKESLLLAEFTRDQVDSAMIYFRTMCARLSQEKENRDDKLDASVNQLEESREGNEGASFYDDASAANDSSVLSDKDCLSGYGTDDKLKGGNGKNYQYGKVMKGKKSQATIEGDRDKSKP